MSDDALKEYRRKRDFRKTPEPAGQVAARPQRERFFCVQKHLASHLHYDFRLEHKGVLLSWAVPKGPSLDPKTKRLAMHVEDHPLDYGDFEGVIPEGYGAGIVLLWDKGTWTPEADDVDATLAKGDLKFKLNGYKLKGSWVLVRTGGRFGGGARSWLLIKHRDEWAGDLDITEFAPLSVKSSGDFEDILAGDTPAVWVSNRPAKGGEAGAMLAKIIERAASLKAERVDQAPEKGKEEKGKKKKTPDPRAAGAKPAGANRTAGATRSAGAASTAGTTRTAGAAERDAARKKRRGHA